MTASPTGVRVRRYALIDVFAGCGGFTYGFVGTGRFDPRAAVESDREAAATYRENLGDHVYEGDIDSWLGRGSLPPADIVIGGPPCQGFSNLGSRRGDDPRNFLWERFAETVERVRPVLFVLENVSDFLRSKEFAELVAATKRGGHLRSYALDYGVLNSAHYGAAQNRRRAIIIGRLKELRPLGLPEPTHHGVEHSLEEVLSGISPAVLGTSLPRPAGPYTTEELHVSRDLSDLTRRRIRAIPYGGARVDLPADLQPPCWQIQPKGAGDVMGRLVWDRPSITIRTEFFRPEKGRYLHPEENRTITHLEAALIQGFPREYKWHGSLTSIGRQIGNAVPVPLAQAIGQHVARSLDDVLL